MNAALCRVRRLLCLAGCRPPRNRHRRAPSEWFVDRTDETGLNFTHFNGMTGDFYPEVMPPGVALLDFDNDGDLDVFVQGDMFSGKVIDAALSPPKSPLSSRLFRNDVGPVLSDGPLRFTDVTERARIDVRGYAWARRRATTTTTAASISTSQAWIESAPA